jgi:hypothetical protein
MDSKSIPSKVYTIIANINNARNEKKYTTKGEAKKINNGGRVLLPQSFST